MITEAQAKRNYIASQSKLEKFYGKKLDALEKERDEKTDRIYEEYSYLLEDVENEMEEKDNEAYDKYMKVVDHYQGIAREKWAEKVLEEKNKKAAVKIKKGKK